MQSNRADFCYLHSELSAWVHLQDTEIRYAAVNDSLPPTFQLNLYDWLINGRFTWHDSLRMGFMTSGRQLPYRNYHLVVMRLTIVRPTWWARECLAHKRHQCVAHAHVHLPRRVSLLQIRAVSWRHLWFVSTPDPNINSGGPTIAPVPNGVAFRRMSPSIVTWKIGKMQWSLWPFIVWCFLNDIWKVFVLHNCNCVDSVQYVGMAV